MPKIKHTIIKWARETSKLSIEEAAHKLNIKDSKNNSAVEKLIAYESGKKEGLYPAFYSYANELLVYKFLENVISFIEIEKYMEKALEKFYKDNSLNKKDINIENIKKVEKIAENIINNLIG